MTSKKKRYSRPAAAPPVKPTRKATTTREWVIRAVAVLVIAVGVTMALIGVTPDIAGGWGKLLLVVPGTFLAVGGVIAFVETTSQARSQRVSRRRFGR
jgi:peptidoglycan/LPS O-acetylase OafA/YrhL